MLDQLLGGDMPLAVIRQVFSDDRRFIQAMLAMLHDGEVRLLRGRVEVPAWERRQLLESSDRWEGLTLSITERGAGRIA